MSKKLEYVFLLTADSNFKNNCENPKEYLDRLKSKLAERIGGEIIVKTINGKYGLLDVDPELDSFEIDNKNKTNFIQTMENISEYINELVIITVVKEDPFLKGIKTALGINNGKTVTNYGYILKNS